jgi:hypothetical protein
MKLPPMLDSTQEGIKGSQQNAASSPGCASKGHQK